MCKRLDCNIDYAGFLHFDGDSDTWQNHTNIPDANLASIQKNFIEHRSREEYRLTLETKTDREITDMYKLLPVNVEGHSIGPVFYSEIIRAMKRINTS